MTEHHWPGNVRELANVVERAVILCPDPVLQQEHLGALAPIGVAPPRSLTLHGGAGTDLAGAAAGMPGAKAGPSGAMPLAEMEKQAIADALQRANGNKSRAAALLGVTRMQLYTRLKRFGLAASHRRSTLLGRRAPLLIFTHIRVDPHTRDVSVHAGPRGGRS